MYSCLSVCLCLCGKSRQKLLNRRRLRPQPQKKTMQEYDATLLMEKNGPFPFKILVDQGEADKFLAGASSGWLVD